MILGDDAMAHEEERRAFVEEIERASEGGGVMSKYRIRVMYTQPYVMTLDIEAGCVEKACALALEIAPEREEEYQETGFSDPPWVDRAHLVTAGKRDQELVVSRKFSEGNTGW